MSKELKEFLSIIESATASGYAPLSLRSAIKLGHLNAELIRVKNRPTYRIKRTDLAAWLATKGGKIKGDA